MSGRKLEVFTTEQVTRLLGLDPKRDTWRVIKFSESREYNIVPSISTASGSGSRRLYDVENACELAMALHLLEAGLRSKVIGRVIKESGELAAKLDMDDVELEHLKLLILRHSEPGRLLRQTRHEHVAFHLDWDELQGIMENALLNPDDGVNAIVVPIGWTFFTLKKRLAQLRSETSKEG